VRGAQCAHQVRWSNQVVLGSHLEPEHWDLSDAGHCQREAQQRVCGAQVLQHHEQVAVDLEKEREEGEEEEGDGEEEEER
jgi:hypothetical protein